MQVPFARESYLSQIPINWYPALDTDKETILMGAPGLSEIITLSPGLSVRGLKSAGGFLYAVCGSSVYKISSSFAVTSLGTITTTTGPVWIEYNGVQVCFVDGLAAWVYTISSGAFAQITDVDFPGAKALTYQDGYGAFIVPDTGQFYLTALYDFSDITSTDYASAEGWPDDLVSIIMSYRELWLFGADTIEVWYNAGSSPFPFARVQGGFIEQGCAASASVAKGDNMVYWLSSGRQVMRAQGYQPQIISTRKLEREFDNLTTINDAIGFIQVFEGHTFYWLTFPTENVTYCFDASTQVWHRRASWPDNGRHRANCYAYFAGKHVIGDYLTGRLYAMDRDYYSDDGKELIAVTEAPEIRGEGKRQFFGGLELQFRRGNVSHTVDPQAMLRYSDDGGNVWSTELWSPLGNLGDYRTRTIWRRLGSSYNRIFRVAISDPVCRDLLSVNWI